MTTLSQVGAELLRIHDAAAGRQFTKSQADDFWAKANEALNIMRAQASAPLAVLKSASEAVDAGDADKLVAALKTPGERKTTDGNPGAPARERAPSYGSTDAGQPITGRKSLHAESWGNYVWDVAEQNGLKALVSSGSVAVPLPITTPPVTEAQRVTFLRQLIPTETTETGAFSYLRQTVRTNNAAVVPEGTRKPTSVYTMVRVDDRVDTIAHLSEPIPRQYLEDAPLLRQFVDSELRYGLDLALDAEILDTILDAVVVATNGFSDLTSVRKAITELQESDFEPSGIVMSPADWETLELEAASTFAANPTFNPANAMTRRLYGIPVVVSTAMSDGNALIGDFNDGAELYMRQQARVDWSENIYRSDLGDGNPGTDFEANMITFRAELRAKLAVLRPSAFLQLASGS